MIDTATVQIKGLEIPQEYLSRFEYMSGSRNGKKYVFNPELEKDGYMPKVTVKTFEGPRGWYTESIEIEGSQPKVLHSTNYFGVDENDYNLLIDKQIPMLKDIFADYPISRERFERANLRTIAFSFNFIVPNDFGNFPEYLKKISFLDVGKNYKKTRNDIYFETETGYCIRFYNPGVSIKLYDKTAELVNKKKKTQYEEALVKAIKQGLIPFRVLRLEVTLQNRQAVKKYFAARTDGDTKRERTLKEAFNNDLCQGILFQFFEALTNRINVQALDMPLYPISEAFKRVRRAGMQPYDAYAFLGRALATQQSGSLQLKLIGDDHFMRQDRFRSDKRMQKLLALHPLPQFTLGKLFEECRKQLTEFKIMKPGDIDLTSISSTP